MVYFLQGDMTLRWVEVGGTAVFAEGRLFSCLLFYNICLLVVSCFFTQGGAPVSTTVSSLALVPQPHLDLLKAEINRVLVLSPDAVVPVSITVPRRQLLDFHKDLFPSFRSYVPAQEGKSWLGGSDEQLGMIEQDPNVKEVKLGVAIARSIEASSINKVDKIDKVIVTPQEIPVVAITSQLASSSMNSNPITLSTPPSSISSPAPITPITTPQPQSIPTPSSSSPIPSPAPAVPTSKASTPPASSPVVMTSASAVPSSAASSSTIPTTRFNERWSRKFIGGKTPLKPDYYGLHSLNTSMSADSSLFKVRFPFLFISLRLTNSPLFLFLRLTISTLSSFSPVLGDD